MPSGLGGVLCGVWVEDVLDGMGRRTYHTPHLILIIRIPPNTHHHRPHPPFPFPFPFFPSYPFSLFFLSFPPPQAPLIHIHTRPPVIHPALHVFIPAHAQAREWDVGRRDAQLGAPAAETLDDGAGEADWEGGLGAGWGADGGEGAGSGGAHWDWGWCSLRGGGWGMGREGFFESGKRIR